MAEVPITPSVLNWAIASSGRSVRETADHLKMDENVLKQWLKGTARPTIGEWKALAKAVYRAPAVLLLPAPPEESLTVAFRRAPSVARDHESAAELKAIREALRVQDCLTWLSEPDADDGARLPKFAPDQSAIQSARRARSLLGISEETQIGWGSDSEAFGAWREALEELGIATLVLRIGPDQARGFSRWHPAVPIVAVNSAWNVAARTFTLMHEFGHLLTRTDSLCVGVTGKDSGLERWCEEFASEVLLPEHLVAHEVAHARNRRLDGLALAKRIASRTHASLAATVIALIRHQVLTWDDFKSIPARQDWKQAGGGGSGEKRHQARKREYGQLATTRIVSAVETQKLDFGRALSYLRIGAADFDKLKNDQQHGE